MAEFAVAAVSGAVYGAVLHRCRCAVLRDVEANIRVKTKQNIEQRKRLKWRFPIRFSLNLNRIVLKLNKSLFSDTRSGTTGDFFGRFEEKKNRQKEQQKGSKTFKNLIKRANTLKGNFCFSFFSFLASFSAIDSNCGML